jgi:hypothetical protein
MRKRQIAATIIQVAWREYKQRKVHREHRRLIEAALLEHKEALSQHSNANTIMSNGSNNEDTLGGGAGRRLAAGTVGRIMRERAQLRKALPSAAPAKRRDKMRLVKELRRTKRKEQDQLRPSSSDGNKNNTLSSEILNRERSSSAGMQHQHQQHHMPPQHGATGGGNGSIGDGNTLRRATMMPLMSPMRMVPPTPISRTHSLSPVPSSTLRSPLSDHDSLMTPDGTGSASRPGSSQGIYTSPGPSPDPTAAASSASVVASSLTVRIPAYGDSLRLSPGGIPSSQLSVIVPQTPQAGVTPLTANAGAAGSGVAISPNGVATTTTTTTTTVTGSVRSPLVRSRSSSTIRPGSESTTSDASSSGSIGRASGASISASIRNSEQSMATTPGLVSRRSMMGVPLQSTLDQLRSRYSTANFHSPLPVTSPTPSSQQHHGLTIAATTTSAASSPTRGSRSRTISSPVRRSPIAGGAMFIPPDDYKNDDNNEMAHAPIITIDPPPNITEQKNLAPSVVQTSSSLLVTTNANDTHDPSSSSSPVPSTSTTSAPSINPAASLTSVPEGDDAVSPLQTIQPNTTSVTTSSISTSTLTGESVSVTSSSVMSTRVAAPINVTSPSMVSSSVFTFATASSSSSSSSPSTSSSATTSHIHGLRSPGTTRRRPRALSAADRSQSHPGSREGGDIKRSPSMSPPPPISPSSADETKGSSVDVNDQHASDEEPLTPSPSAAQDTADLLAASAALEQRMIAIEANVDTIKATIMRSAEQQTEMLQLVRFLYSMQTTHSVSIPSSVVSSTSSNALSGTSSGRSRQPSLPRSPRVVGASSATSFLASTSSTGASLRDLTQALRATGASEKNGKDNPPSPSLPSNNGTSSGSGSSGRRSGIELAAAALRGTSGNQQGATRMVAPPPVSQRGRHGKSASHDFGRDWLAALHSHSETKLTILPAPAQPTAEPLPVLPLDRPAPHSRRGSQDSYLNLHSASLRQITTTPSNNTNMTSPSSSNVGSRSEFLSPSNATSSQTRQVSFLTAPPPPPAGLTISASTPPRSPRTLGSSSSGFGQAVSPPQKIVKPSSTSRFAAALLRPFRSSNNNNNNRPPPSPVPEAFTPTPPTFVHPPPHLPSPSLGPVSTSSIAHASPTPTPLPPASASAASLPLSSYEQYSSLPLPDTPPSSSIMLRTSSAPSYFAPPTSITTSAASPPLSIRDPPA